MLTSAYSTSLQVCLPCGNADSMLLLLFALLMVHLGFTRLLQVTEVSSP